MKQLLILTLVAALSGSVLVGCAKKAEGQGAAMPPTRVVAIAVKRQAVIETLPLLGSILANEMVEMKSETEGIVQEINFKEGEQVEKGRLLVSLDEGKFATAVAEAEANFKLSQANFERSKQLLLDKLISQQEFDQAAAVFGVNEASLGFKKRQLKDTRILAPFSGVVGAQMVSPGQVINKNTTLTWLVDLDPVKVELNVPERHLSELRIGQAIEFNVAAYPGKTFRGEVYFIAPQVETLTRTALVKARMPNAEHLLRPGMFAGLELTLRVRESAVVIPEVALISDGENLSVFVVDENQTAQAKPVKLGIRLLGQIEITSGLQGGEQLIVEGLQKVRPGGKVVLAPPEAAAPYQYTNGVAVQASKT